MREQIQWFAEQMELKLQENDHKVWWGESSNSYLIKRLKQEMEELIQAIIDNEGSRSIIRECADIGLIANMIADNHSDRATKPKGRGQA